MPMLAELERRFTTSVEDASDRGGNEEVLVRDDRARLSPAQLVEQKLRNVMQTGQFVAATISGWHRRRKPR
jgi:phage terminase Nu1 subunit (DNA packaging protein)